MANLDKDVPCAFCGHTVVGTRFLACSECDIPIHADCWQLAGKCPAYACGSVTGVDPAIALYRKHLPALVAAQGKTVPANPSEAPAALAERIERIETQLTLGQTLPPAHIAAVVALVAVSLVIYLALPPALGPGAAFGCFATCLLALGIKTGPLARKQHALRNHLRLLRTAQEAQQLESEPVRRH